eukprot:TRINITY_DN87195_c0_g1_i1.p1 TRINITY_DN87195_c0_g1~~TRINITY_DN87195_c0_g1_i1.p1  ORF type:complete len:222 (+),score=44.08 TRINITY_DN87195_c0_g1_i1:41-667(+)
MPSSSWRIAVLACVISGVFAQKVSCSTTAGNFTVALKKSYSPKGVARFLELVDSAFFSDQLLYRVIEGFIVQFGVAADPAVQSKYQDSKFEDEPNKEPFRAGTLSFAGSGPNTRSCHMFVALEPNGVHLGNAPHETTLGHLDKKGIKTFEKVVANHKANAYPDTGSLQTDLVEKGNTAAAQYPKLDKIIQCSRKVNKANKKEEDKKEL